MEVYSVMVKTMGCDKVFEGVKKKRPRVLVINKINTLSNTTVLCRVTLCYMFRLDGVFRS